MAVFQSSRVVKAMTSWGTRWSWGFLTWNQFLGTVPGLALAYMFCEILIPYHTPFTQEAAVHLASLQFLWGPHNVPPAGPLWFSLCPTLHLRYPSEPIPPFLQSLLTVHLIRGVFPNQPSPTTSPLPCLGFLHNIDHHLAFYSFFFFLIWFLSASSNWREGCMTPITPTALFIVHGHQ